MGSRPKTRCRGREFRCPFSKRVHSAGAATNHLFSRQAQAFGCAPPDASPHCWPCVAVGRQWAPTEEKRRQLIETVALPMACVTAPTDAPRQGADWRLHPKGTRRAPRTQSRKGRAAGESDGHRLHEEISRSPPGVAGPRTRPPNEDRRLGHCLSRQRSRCGARGLCVRNCRWPLRFTQD